MEPNFFINKREVNINKKPLLIAEIGINHAGSLDVAKSMVDAAYRAGIEVIKHQTHIPEDEYSSEGNKAIPGNSTSSILEIMQKCALSEKDEYALFQYTKSKDMIFISTPFSKKALERIIDFNLPAIKIGSGECSNYPLLKEIGSYKKPVILSTGMNNIDSIKKAIKSLSLDKSKLALLHTTNLYPTPYDHVRLSAMIDLHRNFPSYIFGLSDHTIDSVSSLGAVALGASIIERHFTDSKIRKGPDICCSMDEDDARDLVIDLEKMRLCISPGAKKEAHPNEQVTINFAFASVVSMEDILPGELFSQNNIWVKRPGTGEINAENYEKLIGKKAMGFIPKNTQLKWKQISD
tara:strand:+ start:3064 stop:4113 length:1050 start_codon:yes stop_codon:yes gene_type:complete